MTKLLAWLFRVTNGWKTVIGVILAQIPWFSDKPLLVGAIEKVVANPKDAQAWGELIVQLLIIVGVVHRVAKNVTGK
jgi:hypothetical protein